MRCLALLVSCAVLVCQAIFHVEGLTQEGVTQEGEASHLSTKKPHDDEATETLLQKHSMAKTKDSSDNASDDNLLTSDDSRRDVFDEAKQFFGVSSNSPRRRRRRRGASRRRRRRRDSRRRGALTPQGWTPPGGTAGKKLCSHSSDSRRRCPKVKYNCAKSNKRCNVMVGNFKSSSLLQKGQLKGGSGCVAFSAICGGTSYCGLTHKALGFLAADPFNISAKSSCFKREGGYGWFGLKMQNLEKPSTWVPAWYKNRDYRNTHKCIDKSMAREMKICDEEGKQALVRARKDFMDGMTKCLGDFNQLKKQCSSPNILAKMNKCKSDVYHELMGRKSREKFMVEYRKCKAKLPPQKKSLMQTEIADLEKNKVMKNGKWRPVGKKRRKTSKANTP